MLLGVSGLYHQHLRTHSNLSWFDSFHPLINHQKRELFRLPLGQCRSRNAPFHLSLSAGPRSLLGTPLWSLTGIPKWWNRGTNAIRELVKVIKYMHEIMIFLKGNIMLWQYLQDLWTALGWVLNMAPYFRWPFTPPSSSLTFVHVLIVLKRLLFSAVPLH